MEFDDGQEVLCVTLRDRLCLFEFDDIVEICGGMKIAGLPGLPPCFFGVCDYKGIILPVFDGRMTQDRNTEKDFLLVLSEPNGKFGILVRGEMYILSLQGGEWVEGIEKDKAENDGEYRLMKKDGRLYYRICVSKMIEGLFPRPI